MAVRHRPLPTASYGELDSVLDHLQVREEPPATADEVLAVASDLRWEDGRSGLSLGFGPSKTTVQPVIYLATHLARRCLQGGVGGSQSG